MHNNTTADDWNQIRTSVIDNRRKHKGKHNDWLQMDHYHRELLLCCAIDKFINGEIHKKPILIADPFIAESSKKGL